MLEAATFAYDQVTRRWTQLPGEGKDQHACRLLGVPLAEVHLGAPGAYNDDHYRTLVAAALDGDSVAFAWLAETHRALLVARGRALLHHDPDTWSEVSLELLLQALRRAANAAGPWSRRQAALHLSSRMARTVRRHGRRAVTEVAVSPYALPDSEDLDDSHLSAHPDLSFALDTALGRLPAATADGLRAMARLEPLTLVAERHAIDEAALRQRMARARARLRPQLAGFIRAAS